MTDPRVNPNDPNSPLKPLTKPVTGETWTSKDIQGKTRYYGWRQDRSYWENPQTVARYHMAMQAQGPDWKPPDYINRDQISAANDYLSARNNGAPWWQWKALNPDDPGRAFLQSIPTPPNNVLQWPGEEKFHTPENAAPTQPYTPIAPTELTKPELGGITQAQYDVLHLWQKAMIWIMNSPTRTGIVQSAPLAIAAAATGNLPAAGLVLGTGAILGVASEPAVAKAIAPIFGATEQQYQKTIGDAMYDAFGIVPEVLERVLGISAEAYGSLTNPEKYGAFNEIINNLPAAWRAAHFTLENIQVELPGAQAGKQIWTLTNPNPQPLIGQMGLAGLTEERRSLASGEASQLIAQGMPLDEVYSQMAQRYGFSGEVKQFIGQTVLYMIGERAQRSIFTTGLKTIAEKTGNMPLAEAAITGEGRPLETVQKYKGALQTTPIETLKEMSGFSRYLAGVDAEGNVLNLEPKNISLLERMRSGAIVGGLSAVAGYGLGGPGGALAGLIGGGGIGMRLNYLAQMDPASRAHEVIGNASNVIQNVLGAGGDDPATMVKYCHGLANTPLELSKELSQATINSPDGAVIPMFMGDAVKDADVLLSNYQASRGQADIINNIAKVAELKPEEVTARISTTKDTAVLLQQFVDKARTKTDDVSQAIVKDYDNKTLTPDILQKSVQAFTGKNPLPFSKNDFDAQLYAAIMDKASSWSSDYFGVKPDPTWARLGQTIKAAQSLVLLGLNPNFMLQNVMNNAVVMAAEGVFGLRTPAQIDELFKRAGINPMRLRAGVGPTAEGAEAFGVALKEAKVEPGTMTDLQRFLQQKVGKLAVFSKLSGKMEQLSSAEAYATGFLKNWSKLNRPGVGFSRMTPDLEASLRQIHPNAPDAVYAAIQGSMNQKEIETTLWQNIGKRNIEMGIGPVVEAMNKTGSNLTEAGVRDMLTSAGVYDALNKKLVEATTTDEIRKAFRDVQKTVEDHLTKLGANAIQKQAEQAAAQVKAGGLAGVVQLWDQLNMEFADNMFGNYLEEGDAAARAEASPDQKSQIWAVQKAKSAGRFALVWKGVRAKFLGMFEGLGMDSQVSRDILENVVKREDNWKQFYIAKYKLQDTYFSATDKVGTWSDIQGQIAELYRKTTGEDVRLQGLTDKSFVDQVGKQWPEKTEAVDAWRKTMLGFQQEYGGRWDRFYQYLLTIPQDERNAAFVSFHNKGISGVVEGGQLDYLRKFYQGQIDGAHALYGRTVEQVTQIPEMRIPEQANLAVEGKPAITAPVEQVGPTPPSETTLPAQVQPTVVIPESPKYADQVREIASSYGIVTANEDGTPKRGSDAHILNMINSAKINGEGIKQYASLDEVPPEVVKQRLENRKYWADMNKSYYGPRDKLATTVPEVPGLSDLLATEAHNVMDELANTGVEKIGTGEPGMYTRASSNPEWYKKMFDEGYTKDSIRASLQRIIDDAGKDAIKPGEKTMQRVKSFLYGRLEGTEPSAIPGHPALMLAMGNFDGAVKAFGSYMEQGMPDFTDQDWYNLAGSQENFEKLFAAWENAPKVPDGVDEIVVKQEAAQPETVITEPQPNDIIVVENADGTRTESTYKPSGTSEAGAGTTEAVPTAPLRVAKSVTQGIKGAGNLEAGNASVPAIPRVEEAPSPELSNEPTPAEVAQEQVVQQEKIVNRAQEWQQDMFTPEQTMPLFTGTPPIGRQIVEEALNKLLSTTPVEPTEKLPTFTTAPITPRQFGDFTVNAEVIRDGKVVALVPDGVDTSSTFETVKGTARILGVEPQAEVKPIVHTVDTEPWKYTAQQYQMEKGVKQPSIAEISPFQYQGLSNREKARYDKLRGVEWQASADIKTEWKNKVVEAYQKGEVDRNAPGVTDEAKSVMFWADEAAKKANAEEAIKANPITSPAELQTGDRVWSIMYGKYGTVGKIFKKSVEVVWEEPTTTRGKEWTRETIDARALQWKNYDDAHAAAEAGNSINPRVAPAPLYQKPVANVPSGQPYKPAWVYEVNGDIRTMPIIQGGAEPNAPAAIGPLDQVGALETDPPIADIQREGYENYALPFMRQLEDYLVKHNHIPDELNTANLRANLPPEVAGQLHDYLQNTYGQMADTKLTAVKMAEQSRDMALLNYGQRYGFDNVLQMAFPYEFWYGRSALNWALRAIDRPQWMATYARIRNMQHNVMNTPGFPTRLKDKIRINLPFLPSWMGDAIYLDPFKQIFPFEQYLRPFNQVSEDNSTINKRALQILSNWQDDETATPADVQTASSTMAGPLWEKALAQSKIETDAETSNPYDFMSMMMSWSLPIQWAYYGLTGQKDKIGQLPVTRFVNTITAAAGVNQGRGLNLEGPVRRALGMPETDEYGDYRIDRMLANMAADGTITTDEATRAMIDRSGATFVEAQKRVSQSRAISYVGQTGNADILPTGEAKQRAISTEYDRAIKAWQAGDNQAMTKFYDTYPEYSARKAMSQEPAVRLKKYLEGELWDRYNALPSIHKTQITEQLGADFQNNFVNKDTRNYDLVDVNQMAAWAKAMGAQPLETQSNIPASNVTLATPEITNGYEAFKTQAEQQWPGIQTKLNLYYTMPQGYIQDAYAKKYPEIQEYNTARENYLAQNPAAIPYVISQDNKIYGAKPEVQAEYYQYLASRDNQFPGIFTTQSAYFDAPSKSAYLAQHPELSDYWDWRKQFMAQYPDTIPYVMSADSLASSVLGNAYQGTTVSNPYDNLKPPDFTQQFSPALMRQIQAYKYTNTPIGEGGRMELRRIWHEQGDPGNTFDDWIETIIDQSTR
jgi:hypothetical protein